MQNNCKKCMRPISNDDMGATKKLVNRGTAEYLCIPCLAEKFNIPEPLLREKIEYWREMGCTLFPPKTDE